MATEKTTVARTDESGGTEEGVAKQHVDRTAFEISDGQVGPFFPSGMSAPEAAMAGATAGMSDEALAKIEEMKAVQGYGGTRATEEDVEEDGA